ncbi:PTS sugar transporter subunit IIA [Lapidilactobacillus luobeiensis]|uniref:PTS sugar transporter subunit IIA n=1 Tax=Lapidilactobacillus luobeiensis TaxID=2950371 RepID=UPI0021C350DF|nr:PTS glucose transporter subunit IIA [Lapidilactobacillus luobeiensis]
MLGGLFQKQIETKAQSQRLFSPVDGNVIPLAKVADPVFAQGTLGRGFAIEPSDGLLYAPVSGKVTLIATTKHAIIFHQENGLDVMLHLGLNTAPLQGTPFRIHVSDGQTIRGGKRIGYMNRAKISAAGDQPTVIVVVTNAAEALTDLAVDYGPTVGGRQIGLMQAR